MLTSCPECKTTFRLTQEQLSQRRGLVRCGRCKAVFNAYHTLLPDLVEPAEAPAEESAASPVALPETAKAVIKPAVADQASPTAELLAALRQAQAAPKPIAPEAAAPSEVPYTAIRKALAEAEPTESNAPSPADLALNPPTIHDILLSELPTQPARSGTGLWKRLGYGLLSLILLVLLVLQAAYFLRAELAAVLPEARPLLEEMCSQFACTVPLPHQLDKRAIVASSLEHDAERAAHVRLTVLLANRTGGVQAWPQLLLTLLDLREAPVAIKTFEPGVYLPSGLREEAGMAAGHEVEVRLDLELGKLEAAGYTVDLVYPQ